MKCIIENSGMTLEADYTEENIRDIFLPLLRRLTDMQRRKGGRVLALLAAPPATGKSTLAAFLRALSTSTPGVSPLTAIALDGFHRRQAYLLSHTVERNGEVIPMARIKGAPVTFDLERLHSGLSRVAAGEKCAWPGYDRRIHDPVPDALRVEGDIVLLEGNYLLLDEDGWRELRRLADYTIGIEAEPRLLRERLIARHIAGGMSPEAAAHKADDSDMANVRLCLERSLPADLRLRLTEDGSFDVI